MTDQRKINGKVRGFEVNTKRRGANEQQEARNAKGGGKN